MPSPWQSDAMRSALAAGLCSPPECGGSLRPWAPLLVPARLSSSTLRILLPALVELDKDYLREHPGTPPLYASGVWYEPEPPGQEQWLTIPWCLVRRDNGRGVDCEDLACWRVAELHLRLGETGAEAIETSRLTPSGARVYHIRVRRGKVGPDGNRLIEDPSAVLGMGRPELHVEAQTAQNPHASGTWFDQFITDGERL